MDNKFYELPKLNYGYADLAPYMSEEQLRIHHTKHHQAYVSGANDILEKIDRARKEGIDLDMKATLKALSFNIGGHVLHSLFWENIAPHSSADAKPVGALAKEIDSEFGSFERFKKEFTQAAMSIEGSGWAALTFCTKTNRPIIMQIEKHNTNLYPQFSILLVLDMFEHAFYIDYKNEKAKFVDAFWSIASWKKAEKRFEETKK